MEDVTNFVEAIGDIAWPLIFVVVLWKLWPLVMDVIRGRGFRIKLPGGAELTVQQATDQERALIGDLVKRVADQENELERLAGLLGKRQQALPPGLAEGTADVRSEGVSERPRLARRLLVAGKPLTESEIALLVEDGATVVRVQDARDVLPLVVGRPPFDAIITDPGDYDPASREKSTGWTLLDVVREREEETPPVFMMQREPAGYGNWTKWTKEAGAAGFAADLVDLSRVMRSAGLRLFATSPWEI